MIRPTFSGRSILVVEDEALIAMDIAAELEKHGARVDVAHSQQQALQLVEADDLSAAILDHGLQDVDSSVLCERLAERRIPFVNYSGYHNVKGACANGPVVEQPASIEMLLATLDGVLTRRWGSSSPR